MHESVAMGQVNYAELVYVHTGIPDLVDQFVNGVEPSAITFYNFGDPVLELQ